MFIKLDNLFQWPDSNKIKKTKTYFSLQEAQTANKENVHRDEDNHHTSEQEYFTEPTYPRRPTNDPCSRRVTFANISGSERSRVRPAPRRIISKQLIEDSAGKSRPTILKPAKNKTVAENVEHDFCVDSEHDDYSSQEWRLTIKKTSIIKKSICYRLLLWDYW